MNLAILIHSTKSDIEHLCGGSGIKITFVLREQLPPVRNNIPDRWLFSGIVEYGCEEYWLLTW